MSDGRVVQGEHGELRLAGILDYRSGPTLREAGQRLIRLASADPVVVDCSEVTRSSSVGVSLLLAYMRDARGEGRAIRFVGLPKDMCEIARVCGLEAILDVSPTDAHSVARPGI